MRKLNDVDDDRKKAEILHFSIKIFIAKKKTTFELREKLCVSRRKMMIYEKCIAKKKVNKG